MTLAAVRVGLPRAGANPAVFRILAGLILCAGGSGCFVPGGGWTMRTGLDVRRYHKPSVFVELVDTRWDEYNRIAEINSTGGMLDARGIVTPNCPPNGGTVPPPGGSVPPPAMMSPPGQPAPPAGGRSAEPIPLPGAPVENLPPPPGVGPTAQRPRSGGPRLIAPADDAAQRSAAGDRRAAAADDDDEDDADDEDVAGVSNRPVGVKLSSAVYVTGRRPRANETSIDASPTTAAAGKSPRRPVFSRLFSRPR